MVRFNISKNPKNSIFVEIKQSLILDPNLDQFENWANNQKSKYMCRLSISKNPKNSIFVKIKLTYTKVIVQKQRKMLIFGPVFGP